MCLFNIQKEIDLCSAAGGGIVTVPPGIYRTGTIFMRDNVTLHLSSGCLIAGSADINDYPPASDKFNDGVMQERGRALILCDHVKNIAITGNGEINGNGGNFPKGDPAHDIRPMLIRFIGCSGIALRQVNLRDSSAWTCHIRDCENVEISDVDILTHVNNNNDGIDIDSSRNVKISGCHVNSGDDGICLKSTKNTPCENITIENCEIRSASAAFKIGTETYGNIRHVILRNCRIERGDMGAIKLLSADGAILENIEISDMEIRNAANPFFIRLCSRGNVYGSDEQKPAGIIRNVSVKNLRAEIIQHPMVITSGNYPAGVPHYAHNALAVMGLPGHPVSGLFFENISLILPGGMRLPQDMPVPEFEKSYPELGYYGVLPAWGVFMRNVENVTFVNFSAAKAAPDIREKTVLINTSGVSGII